jgi:hypothetical protein
MAISQNFPTISPSLSLNFENSKYIDPRINFTRSTTATYVDELGLIRIAPNNTPRFDHDPITGKCLGVLIENQRFNYLNHSEDYSTNTGTINAVVTTNTTIAPDGNLTADTITANSGSAQHGSSKIASNIPINTVCSLSVFVKSGTHNFCRVDSSGVVNWSTNAGCAVNLTDGTIISGSGTVQPYPNGWYRITTYPTTNSSAGVSRGMWVWVAGPDGDSLFNAAGTETINVWGAQIEAHPFPGSYIPTGGSQVTKTGDVPLISGTNFTSWYQQLQGTVYCKYRNLFGGSGAVIRSVYEFKSTNYASEIRSPLDGSNRIRLVHNFEFSPNDNTFLVNSNYRKSIYGYSSTESRLMMDGTATFASPPTHVNDTTKTQVSIGSRGEITQLNGHISQLIYYPVRLTNDQLQTLTK